MKKKILPLILFFISIMFVNNIDVLAEEGIGKYGTKATVCQYCRGDRCYYFSAKSENKYIMYHQSSNKEYEEIDEHPYASPTFGDVLTSNRWSDYVYFSYDLSHPCMDYLYVINFNVDDFIDFQPKFYTYSNFDLDKTIKIMEDDNSKLKKIGNPLTYKLLGYYGLDEELTDGRFTSAMTTLDKNSTYEEVDFSISGRGDLRGCAVLTGPVLEKINWVLNLIKYLGASLVIILGALDFFKAILADDAKENSKAWKRFTTRLIAAVLLFLVPLIIQFLLTTVKIEGVNVDAPTCNIGVTN